MKESLFKIITAVIVTIITMFIIFELSSEEIIVEDVYSSNVSLLNENKEEIDLVEINNLIPYEEHNYFIKLSNYNDLEYRIIFDVITNIVICEYLEVSFNNELLQFDNYRGVSNWSKAVSNEEIFEFSIKLNSDNNILQNLEVEFDFRIESKQ